MNEATKGAERVIGQPETFQSVSCYVNMIEKDDNRIELFFSAKGGQMKKKTFTVQDRSPEEVRDILQGIFSASSIQYEDAWQQIKTAFPEAQD
ncbi:MAG: hypothetical protein COT92_02990 [Candidatus Doudnabacteria bacterium CG10_big_fil_rev_8_21_14_0_10_42_18]|uniref:Uncharacterized protein n=1 Tax=Candidatus Doudnabacteria bacterium CG10_big_fil_rev_8_21_14_0_10_42_18 TaxID=1974552 RepID=A0A2H0VAH7_9BACT|nr:MAG: hypothetical protein COT92_02990 [Candidatus Doudnabacteria bacterium CG10_big_fil_rev_8_21_14_0_10_42_18]